MLALSPNEISDLFNERRTAQVAAYLLHRAGGRLPLLKFMKLMYLAERESLRVFGEPICGDKPVFRHSKRLPRYFNEILVIFEL